MKIGKESRRIVRKDAPVVMLVFDIERRILIR